MTERILQTTRAADVYEGQRVFSREGHVSVIANVQRTSRWGARSELIEITRFDLRTEDGGLYGSIELYPGNVVTSFVEVVDVELPEPRTADDGTLAANLYQLEQMSAV